MHFLIQLVVFCTLFGFYWCSRTRRILLKRRIGRKDVHNLYQIGRNIAFMLSRKRLRIHGDTASLRAGGVLYSIHYGVWELMPATLINAGFRIGIIVNRYAEYGHRRFGYLVDRILHSFRKHDGLRIFYRNNTREIVTFLRGGGILGILVDGNTLDTKLPKAMKLSKICHVPLIPFAAFQEKGSGTLSIGCDLRTLVARRPLDYLWFYKSRSS